jgi:hypothetical protein
VDKAKTDVELATAYGRNSRLVFAEKAWGEVMEHIKVGWELIPVDLSWEIALPRIRAGWDMWPPVQSSY